MAFPSLQAEQGGTAITLQMGLNTHECLTAERRENAMGTDGHSSQALVLLSLEREGLHRTWLQGHTCKAFPSHPHYSVVYPLKATAIFRAQAPKEVGRTGVAI